MTPMLHDILAYSLRILVVAAAAAGAAAAWPLPSVGVRLTFWRGTLLLCLLVPLWPSSRAVTSIESAPSVDVRPLAARPSATSIAPSPGNMSVEAVAQANSRWSLPAGRIVVDVIAAGIGVRILWLAFGLVALRRLRRRSIAVPLTAPLETLRDAIAPRADVRESRDVRQPITFGVRRPVVLLPARFSDVAEETQIAVLAHELHHVRRRDWIEVIAEEIVRSVLWFHVAVHWLLEQLQLSREQVVDSLAADATGRRVYAHALVAFAGELTPAPAIGFARRRHLGLRVRSVLETRPVSQRRVAVQTLLLAVAVVGVLTVVAAAYPMPTQFALWTVPSRPQSTPSPPAQSTAAVAASSGRDSLSAIAPPKHDESVPSALAPVAPPPQLLPVDRPVPPTMIDPQAAGPVVRSAAETKQDTRMGEQLAVVEHGRYRHVKTGITVDMSSGWKLLGTGPSSDGGELAQFEDTVSGGVVALWMKRNEELGPAGLMAQLRGAIPEKIRQRAGFAGYRIRPDSIRFATIGGTPALTADGEFRQGAEPMSECLTWIYSKNERAFLFARVPASDLQAFRPRFREIAESAIVP
jgi:beta-lactamase regulating signal transducer with metallopeptidase domain